MKWVIMGTREKPRPNSKAYWWALYGVQHDPSSDQTSTTKRVLQMEDENEWWVTPDHNWNKEDDIGPFDSFDKACTVAEMLMAQEGEAA